MILYLDSSTHILIRPIFDAAMSASQKDGGELLELMQSCEATRYLDNHTAMQLMLQSECVDITAGEFNCLAIKMMTVEHCFPKHANRYNVQPVVSRG